MAIQTVKTGAAVNDGTGDDARTAFTKINQNFTDNANAASRQVGTTSGNLVEVGLDGWTSGVSTPALPSAEMNAQRSNLSYYNNLIVLTLKGATSKHGSRITIDSATGSPANMRIASTDSATGMLGTEYLIYNGANTTVDGNGFIKAASPIVKLFTDKIELNDEAKLQPIALEKLGVGDYLVKGSTGFAQKGWYIEMPKDANGNVLVAVVYEQLENNDISVKTYDYMLNKKGRIVPDLETPLDIPETRWIDLRLQALPQEDIQPLSTDETVNTNAE